LYHSNGVLTKLRLTKSGPTKLETTKPGHSDIGLGLGDKIKYRVKVKLRN